MMIQTPLKLFEYKDLKVNLDSIDFQIELISPEKAKNYLTCNFKNNRIVKKMWIKELATLMRKKEFYLSWDCLCFNENGILINGQHRLHAVIESNQTVAFCVVRNMPHKVAKLLDNGKKRTQSERITVGGILMKQKECAMVKNAICKLNTPYAGTYLYGNSRYDKLISEIYKKHQKYFQKLDSLGYLSSGYTTFFSAVALKIYVELCNSRKSYKHQMSPFERSVFWLDLCRNGYSQRFQTNNSTDLAPLVLRKVILEKKEKKEATWEIDTLQLCVKAGFQFLKGDSPKRIQKTDVDPFSDFQTLKSTNDYYDQSNIVKIKSKEVFSYE
tara:strand:- start:754 stop:1737 length:984 start_codon:yes stop_codon:yes gene_type:complete